MTNGNSMKYKTIISIVITTCALYKIAERHRKSVSLEIKFVNHGAVYKEEMSWKCLVSFCLFIFFLSVFFLVCFPFFSYRNQALELLFCAFQRRNTTTAATLKNVTKCGMSKRANSKKAKN